MRLIIRKAFVQPCHAHPIHPTPPRAHEQLSAYDDDAIFFIAASATRGEHRICSHLHTGDVTAEKIAEKNR